MHLTHGQAGPGPRCSGRCRGRGKARGAHEPLPRLCAGPRHRINGEAVPLPHPRQGTPSPGTGNQARVPVDEDSAPYSVEDSGADDGAPGFVGPPDEPVLPFSGWISSTQTQIWRATSTPARSRPPNRSWSWARYGRAARPRQACGGRHQLYAAHRGEPQPRTRWCPKRATMGTCGSGVLRTRTETSLGGATTVVAPPPTTTPSTSHCATSPRRIPCHQEDRAAPRAHRPAPLPRESTARCFPSRSRRCRGSSVYQWHQERQPANYFCQW